MKIAAYTALTYGSPYLEYAMRSVIPFVDEYVILYSDHGSHSGHKNHNKPKQEQRETLYRIALNVASQKLKWIDGNWRFEGQQRDSIWEYTDAHIVLAVDYDEIWTPEAIRSGLWYVANDKANVRMPLIHYWRSFRWAVMNDEAAPVRVLLRGAKHETYGGAKLHHFGYAIPDYLMQYKMTIHGHKAEWRSRWYPDKWAKRAVNDVHPTNKDYWFPEQINPDEILPEIMLAHPFYDKEWIE